ncbi:MAG: hypothetical protein H6Q13_1722, partial [Bacteroidetes bacterium]|nr:hypothetical protein [Bacteroidota bacterium]
MEKNNNFSNNTDLNEALKKPTHFIVRYGITIITCMIIIAFASSFFIIIPQIETARVQKISKSDSNNIEIINVIVSIHNIGQLSRNSEIELGIDKNKKIKGHIRNIRQNPNNCTEYEV